MPNLRSGMRNCRNQRTTKVPFGSIGAHLDIGLYPGVGASPDIGVYPPLWGYTYIMGVYPHHGGRPTVLEYIRMMGVYPHNGCIINISFVGHLNGLIMPWEYQIRVRRDVYVKIGGLKPQSAGFYLWDHGCSPFYL
jgi:hypothetical protein